MHTSQALVSRSTHTTESTISTFNLVAIPAVSHWQRHDLEGTVVLLHTCQALALLSNHVHLQPTPERLHSIYRLLVMHDKTSKVQSSCCTYTKPELSSPSTHTTTSTPSTFNLTPHTIAISAVSHCTDKTSKAQSACRTPAVTVWGTAMLTGELRPGNTGGCCECIHWDACWGTLRSCG